MRIASSFVMTAGSLLLVAGSAGAAEGPRYTYAEVGYVNIDIDDIDGVGADGDGFNLAGSVAVADMVHLFGSYFDGDVDVDDFGFGEIGIDYTTFAIGAGLNYAISDTVDLVGRLAYLNAEAEAFGFSEDDDGYGLSAGARAMLMPQFELNGAIVYSDLGGDDGDDTAVGIGAVYSFTEMFAVTASGTFGGDVQEFGVGVRAYFGAR